MRQHDINSGPGHTVRGNVTQTTTPNSVRNLTYDITGTVVSSNNGYGSSVAITPTANNAAPGLITPNSNANLATNYTYTPMLAPDTVTQPNTEVNKTEYDLYGRVSKTISPRGAATTYSYAYPLTTATTNTRWTRTTSDGLGRPVKVETGHGSTVSSIVETEYDSCACSPTGKVKRVSLPYAPGGTPVWTVYTYDGLGRTLSVAPPGGAGSTVYSYEGSTVTVTDPTAKWKKYEQDPFGNLVKVTEPKPGTALTYETTYAYDIFNRLRTVTMPRDGTTQTRTWVYDANQRLSIVTMPESGTTTYSYNANGTLAQKTDAKNQRVTYDYDLFGRVTKINRFATGAPTRDTCQSVDLTWDVPTLTPPGAIAFYTFGRLTRAEWGNAVTANCKGGRIQENYDYDVTGVLRYKQMMITRDSVTKQLDGTWLYDTEGRMLDESYPGYGPQMGYGYDAMGRPNLLRHYWLNPGGSGYLHRDFVLNAQYLTGGQLSSIQYQAGMSPDNWTYNTLGQVTNFTTGALTMEYRYSASANNGRITHQVVDGVEVAYSYNSLNRLIAAQTTAPTGGWGQSYTFDGFGNLTAQTPTKGVTPPPMSLTINPATNRVQGPSYDNNGNMLQVGTGSPVRTYDIENRLVNNGQGGEFAYDLSNRRIWDGQNYWFWAPDGRLLGRYQWNQNLLGIDTRVYFAGRMIGKATTIWVTPNHTRREFTFQRVTRDRLGSVRVTETGQKLDYFPYGEERPTATANGKDKFGTYFRDGELDYANQRYYDYARGRFATADPSMPGDVGNPASWNMYGYVYGDPVNANDPNGLLTIIIGGTVLNPFGRMTADWGQPGTPFNSAVSRFFGEQAVVYEWSGQLFDRIFGGAVGLRDFINAHEFKVGEKLNIVAHSHGGNVAKAYTRFTGRRIDTLITMGTPHRSDFQVYPGSVGNYFNVYSKHDAIQKHGGPWYYFLLPFAARTDPCAVNIGIDRAPRVGRVGHGDLHTAEVWHEMEQWLIRAGYGSNPVNVNGGCWASSNASGSGSHADHNVPSLMMYE